MEEKQNAALGTAPLGKLMVKFALPCTISLLVGALQIMARRPVLELLASPTTTIASQLFERNAASSCRISVALHIVSNISQFVHTFFAISAQLFHIFCELVVWLTMLMGRFRRSGASRSQFSSSSGLCTIKGSRQKLAIASTSGCAGEPKIIIFRPFCVSFFTMV